MECPSNGCARWREWWREKWNRNICRRAPGLPKHREIFRYEHPDLTRQRSRAVEEPEVAEGDNADNDM
jgi:hypothetical protein